MSKGCLKCGAQNPDEARFCRNCGTELDPALAPPSPPDPPLPAWHPDRYLTGEGLAPRRALAPRTLWAVIGAIALAWIAGGAWWYVDSQSPAGPTFDAAPPPLAIGAGASEPRESAASPVASASVPESDDNAAPVNAKPAPVTVAQPGPAEVAPQAPPPPASAAQARRDSDKSAREARAKALREERAKRAKAAAQAEADASKRRAEQARARPAEAPPPPAPVATPKPHPASASTQALTVQEKCGGQNALLKGICEARECFHREHAAESVCVRVKAAEEQRRQRQEGGG